MFPLWALPMVCFLLAQRIGGWALPSVLDCSSLWSGVLSLWSCAVHITNYSCLSGSLLSVVLRDYSMVTPCARRFAVKSEELSWDCRRCMQPRSSTGFQDDFMAENLLFIVICLSYKLTKWRQTWLWKPSWDLWNVLIQGEWLKSWL